MRYTANITAQNTNVYLCNIRKKRDLTMWFAGIQVQGTFGGGTVTLYLSLDGGNTLVPFNDMTGNPYTATQNDNFTVNWGRATKESEQPRVYVGIGAATNPNIQIYCDDNM